MRRLETKFSPVFFFHNRPTLTAWVREITLRFFMVRVRTDFTMWWWWQLWPVVIVVVEWKSLIGWGDCHLEVNIVSENILRDTFASYNNDDNNRSSLNDNTKSFVKFADDAHEYDSDDDEVVISNLLNLFRIII